MIEKYIAFKYYEEVVAVAICLVILVVSCLMIVFGKICEAIKKKQDKKSEEFWKERDE